MSEKKDIIDINNKRKAFKIILILSIIMTSIGIFFASYYSSINKVYDSYETTLVANINGINEVNKNVEQFNSNQIIDVDYAKKQLPIIIKDLSDFSDDLANLEPNSKYKKDYENLKSGLDQNLLIYRQTLAILNNPSGNDVAISTGNLKTYKDDCMNFYSLIGIHNIKISLPKTSLTFIDNVLNYSFTAVSIKKETDIKSQQVQEFLTEIDGLSIDFVEAKTNYYSYIPQLREKKMSYDELLSIVDKDSRKLSEVRSNFKKLSIPPSAIKTYELFRPLLDLHESYSKDFKLALTSEKVQSFSAVVDSATLDALYTSSNKEFGEIDTLYNNFIKSYAELNNK